jgi:hypothetical protein
MADGGLSFSGVSLSWPSSAERAEEDDARGAVALRSVRPLGALPLKHG